MSPPTRRESLHLGAAAVAGLAGCTGQSERTVTPTTGPPGPPDGGVTGYETRLVRNPAGEEFVRDSREDDMGGPVLLATREDAEALRFTATPDGTADAREFVAGTAFGEAALLVDQHAVSACHRPVVDYVTSPDEPLEVGFCRAVRDASVDCDTDDRHVVAAFVRLPFPVDDRADGFGVRTGSTCHTRKTAGGTDATEVPGGS